MSDEPARLGRLDELDGSLGGSSIATDSQTAELGDLAAAPADSAASLSSASRSSEGDAPSSATVSPASSHTHDVSSSSTATSSSASSAGGVRGIGAAGPAGMTSSVISYLELPASAQPYYAGDHAGAGSEGQPASTPGAGAGLSEPSSSSTLAPPPYASSHRSDLGDESALDALVAAHSRHGQESSFASSMSGAFSTDVDADEASRSFSSSVGGHQQRRGEHEADRTGSEAQHPYHHEHQSHHHHSVNRDAPRTTRHVSGEPDTVPSVSATGMPRLIPRRRSHSRTLRSRSRSRRGSTSSASSEDSDDDPPPPALAPSGSLLLALTASGVPLSRRFALLGAAAAVNLLLPFLNGVMLGFGELFARHFVAPMLGLGRGVQGTDVEEQARRLAETRRADALAASSSRRPAGAGVGLGAAGSRSEKGPRTEL